MFKKLGKPLNFKMYEKKKIKCMKRRDVRN